MFPRNSLRGVSRSAARSGAAAQAEQPAESSPAKDPIVEYMEASHEHFQTKVAQPSKALSGKIRSLRNVMVCSGELTEKYPQLLEMVNKIDDEAWTLSQNTKRVGRRFQIQNIRVAKKITAAARPAYATKLKSIRRKEAGKIKAESLATWRQDFSAARAALKQEGYTGSLKLKKGMPMYTKIEEVRRTRIATLPGSAASSH